MKLSNTRDLAVKAKKFLIYGQSGSGKTHSFKTLDQKSTLVISAENGLLTLSDADLDFIDLNVDENGKPVDSSERIQNLSKAYNYLLRDGFKYETVCIDSLTEISQIVADHLDKKYPDRKNAMVKWDEYNKLMMSIIKKFRDLPLNVVITCLSTIEKDEDSKRYMSFMAYGKIANKLPQFFDFVFYLHNAKTEDGIKRYFQTSSEGTIIAKDRSNKLDLYEEIDFKNIFNKVKGE